MRALAGGILLVSKVAVVEIEDNVQESLAQALKLIGGIDNLSTAKKSVVIKPGVFDHRKKNHASPSLINAIANGFSKAPQVFIVESDNYRGTGSERLQVWKEVFTERVVPFSLSEDTDTKQVKIADETIGLSHVLFKPNVFVSTHVLRKATYGTILKNLMGLMPDPKKARFHKKLPNVLLDAYEAIGGIDLAVIDGTYTYKTASAETATKTNALIVGRDALAVDVVGAHIIGLDIKKMPILQEAIKRGIGEGDIEKIKILGTPIETIKKKLKQKK
jgi:uncharacterized protein (DUF362 family)